MNLPNTKYVSELSLSDTIEFTSQAAWVIRGHIAVPETKKSDGSEPRFQYQITKLPSWRAVANELSALDKGSYPERIIDAMRSAGVIKLIAVPFPFFVRDRVFQGYELEYSEEAVVMIGREWFPFEYVLLGISVNNVTPEAVIVPNSWGDYTIFAGTNAFMSSLFESIDQELEEFGKYALSEQWKTTSRDGRKDLEDLYGALKRFNNAGDYAGIVFPLLT